MDNLIGDYVKQRMPSFIKDDYVTFSSLIEAYYDWLANEYELTADRKSVV